MQFSINVPAQPDNQGPSSKTKLRLVVAGVVLLVAAVFVFLFYEQREPSYAGKTLSEWGRELSRGSKDQRKSAAQAVRQIGTNAIPFALKWLRPPLPKSRASEWAEKGADWLDEHTPIHISLPKEPFRRDEAEAIFSVLGPTAESAIPELRRLMGDNKITGELAAACLANIGVKSMLVLTNALVSPDSIARFNALVALKKLGKNSTMALPLIEKLTHDPNQRTARLAILELGGGGPSSSIYIPELNEMLRTNYEGDAVAAALIRLGYTVQILQQLTNESWVLRWNCAYALNGRVFSSPPVQPNAKFMEANWKNTATRFLQRYLLSDDAAIRTQAADDLGFLESSACQAVPALTTASSDTNELVRISATNALKKIDVQFYQGGIVRGPRKIKRIALEFTGHTFAEGGETILNELAKHQAKASFFLTGDFLRNPEFKPLVRRIVQEGHYLGPHSDKHLLYCSWDDPNKTFVTEDAFYADLSANLEEIHRFIPEQLQGKFWLPAYECYNPQIAAWGWTLPCRPFANGFPDGRTGPELNLVNFTPGTRSNADYTQESDKNFVSSQAIFDSIVKKEREDPDGLNGFLLLMHLGAGPGRHDKMHEKFGVLLDYLLAKGYQFVRIDELLD